MDEHEIASKPAAPGHVFYQLGRVIYPLRWFIIALWIIILLALSPLMPNIVAPFKTTGFEDENSKSALAEVFLNKKLGYNNNNKFLIIYSSKSLSTSNPVFFKKIKNSLKGLKQFPIDYDLILPNNNKKQVAKDKHSAYAVVIIKSKEELSNSLLNQFKSLIKPPRHMQIHMGGESIFEDNLNKQTQEDLYKADYIATPVAIITLILVFGSVVAALLPIFLGGGCAMMILSTLYCIGHFANLSVFTVNIALLLGLCLSLDYSLFIINRFRDELRHGHNVEDALAITEATAGKAIFYSGLAVFASLSGLFLFPINILFSVAVGGLTAVFVAVVTAIFFLPAFLAVLKTKINLLHVRILPKSFQGFNTWHWLAEKIVHRPLYFFFPILIVLLMLGYPFISAKFGISDFHIFPKDSENRLFFDTYAAKFNENELTPISVVIKSNKAILSEKNLSTLYDLTQRWKKNPLIADVNSIVTTDPNLSKNEYIALYDSNNKQQPDAIKTLLASTTGHHFTVVDIVSKHEMNSPKTKTLINELEKAKVHQGMSISLTGTPVDNTDVLHKIAAKLPYAIAWIMLSTYFILLFLLRSIFLPIKAILMNLFSLCACYGALVLVFQDGYLHQLFNFEPQGMLDISLLVIIFCAIFGFSMDYEVFLLSRIKEFYLATGDCKNSIVFGIEKSSRIITSAALIVIFLCCSFLVADIIMVKAFGLGIAVAIFVDAFLIRSFLVPATMALLESWNWYLPKWLDKILPR
jgi:RND superfamily putative drug exporter